MRRRHELTDEEVQLRKDFFRQALDAFEKNPELAREISAFGSFIGFPRILILEFCDALQALVVEVRKAVCGCK